MHILQLTNRKRLRREIKSQALTTLDTILQPSQRTLQDEIVIEGQTLRRGHVDKSGSSSITATLDNLSQHRPHKGKEGNRDGAPARVAPRRTKDAELFEEDMVGAKAGLFDEFAGSSFVE